MPLDDSHITQVIPQAVWFKRSHERGYWSFKVFVNDTISLISIIYDPSSAGIVDQDRLLTIGDGIAREAITNINLATVPLYGLEVVIPV